MTVMEATVAVTALPKANLANLSLNVAAVIPTRGCKTGIVITVTTEYVGAADGMGVGAPTAKVGFIVGARVGVEATVGFRVRALVGPTVGVMVGIMVGIIVGMTVGIVLVVSAATGMDDVPVNNEDGIQLKQQFEKKTMKLKKKLNKLYFIY